MGRLLVPDLNKREITPLLRCGLRGQSDLEMEALPISTFEGLAVRGRYSTLDTLTMRPHLATFLLGAINRLISRT